VRLTSGPLPRFLFTGKALRILLHLPSFVRLYWRLFCDRRVSILPKTMLALTLLYLVWPIDVIPDYLPVLGEVDDVGIVLLGLWTFVRLCPPEVVRQHVEEISARGRRRG
jgi:uncharacterized membrane protein YkvA (DUF1232 family)